MRRLVRAITEIESYKTALLTAAWHGPSEPMAVALLNTAIAALLQAEALTMYRAKSHPNIDPKVNHVSELIKQINDEVGRQEEER